MNKINYYEIEVDGVDKTGKDLLTGYLVFLSNFKFSVNTRGIITQIAYSKKFNRNYEYNLDKLSKNKIFVFLTADLDDLSIRCKITKEPKFTMKEDMELFTEVVETLKSKDFIVLHYNTTIITPYLIAKDVLNYINNLEKNNE